MSEGPFTRKDQILAFMSEHPDWYLEFCHGATIDSYWAWVRNPSETSQVVMCYVNAARAAARRLKPDKVRG